MACPYFEPVQRRTSSAIERSPTHAMLPLGDLWTGLCRAPSGPPWQPGDATLRLQCNLGYARETCARFPTAVGPDAVRFAVTRDDDTSLLLQYVIERDHHPYAHGRLEFLRSTSQFLTPPPGEILERQARACVENYLRRTAEARAGRPSSE